MRGTVGNIVTVAALAGLLIIAAAGSARAQRVKTGEKAPEIRVQEWLSASRPHGGARLVEFFHSSSRQNVHRIPQLEGLASELAGRLDVIVVVRDDDAKAVELLEAQHKPFYTMLDSGGKTVENFDVKFVPYGVLIDSHGRVLWAGNVSSLSREDIEGYLK